MESIKLDFGNKKTPIYIRIYETLKERIIRKELEPDEKLPSKRMMASRMGVSVKTIENAYQQLMLEGYIYSKEKSGFYVERIDNYRQVEETNLTYSYNRKEKEYLVDFSSNKNPNSVFPISVWKRLIRELLTEYDENNIDTLDFQGHIKLRIAIANLLFEQRGMKVSPDQIVIGASTDYLYQRLIQMFGMDSIYALEDPGHHYARRILKNSGVKYCGIPIDEHGVMTKPLVESDANILHISPAHQFPLGKVTSINRRIELLEWANEEPNRYIIEDDYNAEYRYQGHHIETMFSISIREKVIYLNTFAKTIMPAIRVSYMVLPKHLVDHYVETTSIFACTASLTTQLTVAKFIEKGYFERYINRIKHLNIAQRKLLVDMIKKCKISDQLQLSTDVAGTHYLVKIHSKLSDEAIKYQLKEKGVLIAYVNEYTIQYNQIYDGVFIINYSRITEEEITYFLKCLEDILK